MELFRVIPRFEIKSSNLIKGINMEGFRKINNFEKRIEKYIKMGDLIKASHPTKILGETRTCKIILFILSVPFS